jgi:hypothetical protein
VRTKSLVSRARLHFSVALFVGMFFGSAALGHAQPVITGVNAFWYLGRGINYDGPGCGINGYCFYAQAAWAVDANGATGTPIWTVEYAGTGRVSLSCTECFYPEATATAPSAAMHTNANWMGMPGRS